MIMEGGYSTFYTITVDIQMFARLRLPKTFVQYNLWQQSSGERASNTAWLLPHCEYNLRCDIKNTVHQQKISSLTVNTSLSIPNQTYWD